MNGLDADASGRNLLLSLDGVAHTPDVYGLAAHDSRTPLDAGFAIAVW